MKISRYKLGALDRPKKLVAFTRNVDDVTKSFVNVVRQKQVGYNDAVSHKLEAITFFFRPNLFIIDFRR